MLTSTQLDQNLVSDPEFAAEMGALLEDEFQVSAVKDTVTAFIPVIWSF